MGGPSYNSITTSDWHNDNIQKYDNVENKTPVAQIQEYKYFPLFLQEQNNKDLG